VADEVARRVVELDRTTYAGFNPVHLAECLAADTAVYQSVQDVVSVGVSPELSANADRAPAALCHRLGLRGVSGGLSLAGGLPLRQTMG
jgi:hypothetical protein